MGNTPQLASRRPAVPTQHRCTLIIDGSEAERAAAFVVDIVRSARADADLISDVGVLTGELLTHGAWYGEVRAVNLAVHCDPAAAEATVWVTGTGNSAVPAPVLPSPEPTAGTGSTGRGLSVLDSLADEWGVSRRHRATTAWFVVRGMPQRTGTRHETGAVEQPGTEHSPRATGHERSTDGTT